MSRVRIPPPQKNFKKKCSSGGIGRHDGLKIHSFRGSRFKSEDEYYLLINKKKIKKNLYNFYNEKIEFWISSSCRAK